MHKPLDSMRLIHWASGAPMSSKLPISDPDPDPGLLGPDSISSRLHEEQWLITADARAVFIQHAHPQVAPRALGPMRFGLLPLCRGERSKQGEGAMVLWSST